MKSVNVEKAIAEIEKALAENAENEGVANSQPSDPDAVRGAPANYLVKLVKRRKPVREISSITAATGCDSRISIGPQIIINISETLHNFLMAYTRQAVYPSEVIAENGYDEIDVIVANLMMHVHTVVTVARPERYLPVPVPEIRCQCGFTLQKQLIESITDLTMYLNDMLVGFVNHRLNADCNRAAARKLFKGFALFGERNPFELTYYQDIPHLDRNSNTSTPGEKRWVLQRRALRGSWEE